MHARDHRQIIEAVDDWYSPQIQRDSYQALLWLKCGSSIPYCSACLLRLVILYEGQNDSENQSFIGVFSCGNAAVVLRHDLG
jgi:hypothetical protein